MAIRLNDTRRKPRKRALLVGINQYRSAPLKGCVNDALMVGNILIDHYGFRPGNDMRLLVDQRATKQGILDRLEWLVDGARAGDVLVFHYSGHGAQVPDRSGDELDNLDECLCPIDFDWDDPLLDEDLGRIIRTVPAEANLTVILDCCHSGTGTRLAVFGSKVPLTKKRLCPPPDIDFRRVGEITIDNRFDERSVTMTRSREMILRRFGRSAEQYGILITGCKDSQLSNDAFIDGDYHGALTYGLYQAIEKNGPGQTYAQWHQTAASLIPTYHIQNQEPQLECIAEQARWRLFSTDSCSTSTVGRRAETARKEVVYVHGICEHKPGYSDSWWRALHPYLEDVPYDNRHEVHWSDIVTPTTRGRMELSDKEQDLADFVRDTLTDRAFRWAMEITPPDDEGRGCGAGGSRAMLGIPGIDCIDDFMKYLFQEDIRDQVIERFMDVVKPLIKKGHQLEIISHSWGTVVAFEALHRLAQQGEVSDHAVHNLFVVGSALSMAPVRRYLIDEAKEGRKPRCVENWVNLDARYDIVGGPLKEIPFDVDFEYLNLKPVGCWPIPFNWACAHSSYFHAENKKVHRDIFARHISGNINRF